MHKIHLYYGYGKGKTTCVMGLSMRALGAGHRVAIVQFDKGYDGQNEHYSERVILRKLKEIGYPIELVPTGCERMMPDGTFRFKNQAEDFAEAQRGLKAAKEFIDSADLNLLVLDEALAAVAYNLLSLSDLIDLLDYYEAKGRPCELVLSGHKIWEELEKRADLITEMRKVKHYFDEGLPKSRQARPGKSWH
jgi:cob(I)alamin adenosyltransferase